MESQKLPVTLIMNLGLEKIYAGGYLPDNTQKIIQQKKSLVNVS